MGYMTTFSGAFQIVPPLTADQVAELRKVVAPTRHEFLSMDSKTGASVYEDGAPDVYCDWVPSDEGDLLEWNGGDKFYHYVDWIEYLIEHFFRPRGRDLVGEVHWSGEEGDDRGVIYSRRGGKVEAVEDTIRNPGPGDGKGWDLEHLTDEEREALRKRLDAIDLARR